MNLFEIYTLIFRKIYRVDLGCYISGIRARPLPVRCGSRTNHAEAGGHVTPEADEGEGGCTACNTRGRRGQEWSPHRNERDKLIRIDGYYLYQQDASSFREPIQ